MNPKLSFADLESGAKAIFGVVRRMACVFPENRTRFKNKTAAGA
jgi:hypothetical protein